MGDKTEKLKEKERLELLKSQNVWMRDGFKSFKQELDAHSVQFSQSLQAAYEKLCVAMPEFAGIEPNLSEVHHPHPEAAALAKSVPGTLSPHANLLTEKHNRDTKFKLMAEYQYEDCDYDSSDSDATIVEQDTGLEPQYYDWNKILAAVNPQQLKDFLENELVESAVVKYDGKLSNNFVRFVCATLENNVDWQLSAQMDRAISATIMGDNLGKNHKWDLWLGVNAAAVCDACGGSLLIKCVDKNGHKRADLFIHERALIPDYIAPVMSKYLMRCPCLKLRMCIYCYYNAKNASKEILNCFEEIAGPRPVSKHKPRCLQKVGPAELSNTGDLAMAPLPEFKGSGNHDHRLGAVEGCDTCARKILRDSLHPKDLKEAVKLESVIGAPEYDLQHYLEYGPTRVADKWQRKVIDFFRQRDARNWQQEIIESCRAVYRCFLEVPGDEWHRLFPDHNCRTCKWCCCAQLRKQVITQTAARGYK